MKQIISIILIVITAGIICALAYIPVKKGLDIYYSNDYKRYCELFEGHANYDLIFIGSSRTIFLIYPKVIDSICGTNSYNAGVNGGKIMDFELMLKGYLNYHPAPKVLVLTLDLVSFSRRHEIQRHNEYYPFLNNKAIASTLTKYGYNADLIRIFPFLGITDLDDYNRENTMRLLKGKGELAVPKVFMENKGFLSIFDGMKPKRDTSVYRGRYEVNNESVAAFHEIIKVCKDHNIKLILAYPPELHSYLVQKNVTNRDTILSMINETAKKNDLPYIRNDSIDLSYDPSLFWNFSHLNEKGAIKYSAILGEELKTFIHSR